jgi:hypothetical protein
MPAKRNKSISTKVTRDEYAALSVAAEPQTISEWSRRILLAAASPNPAEAIILAEILALRTILLNMHFDVCRGIPVTAETLEQLITHGDREKVRNAHTRLGVPVRRTES